MKLQIQVGSTSQTVNVFIRDSSSGVGAGLTGLAFNTASLTAYYALPAATPVAITLATLAAVTSAWSSGGFKEMDATNMPGWYRFDIPNAAIASGRFADIHLKGATNMAPLPIEIQLVNGIFKNMPFANFEFPMVLSSDHVTPATGLTVAGAVSIDGGAFAALANTPATEVSAGVYKILLAAADTNGTTLTYKFTSATADQTLISVVALN